MEPSEKRIFLSYGHDHYAEVVVQLKADLEKHGYQVWFDLDRLKAGTNWEAYIEEGIDWVCAAQENGHFVIVMTPHSVRRPDGFCRREILRSQERKIQLIPILLAPCEAPISIAHLQHIDMRECLPFDKENLRYQKRVDELVEALEKRNLDNLGRQSLLQVAFKPIYFNKTIDDHHRHFVGRQWIINDIKNWLSDDNAAKVFWLAGLPGCGKTAIASWLGKEEPAVIATHLCKFTNKSSLDPVRFVKSLAYHLSTQLPDYSAALISKGLKELSSDSQKDAGTIADDFIVKLLPPNEKRRIIVIDGLDEATINGTNPFTRLIKNHLINTPQWLRIFVTSRIEPEIQYDLQGFKAKILDTSAKENQADARQYIKDKITLTADYSDQKRLIEQKLLEDSEGSFLYLDLVRKEHHTGLINLEDIINLPMGVGGKYSQFFDRQFNDTDTYKTILKPALSVIFAAREPIKIEVLAQLLKWSEDQAYDCCATLGSMFVDDQGYCQAFHKSLLEWIIDRKKAGPYRINPADGEHLIATQGLSILQDSPENMPVYLIKHLPSHLSSMEQGEIKIVNLLLNFDWLSLKLEQTDIFSVLADFELLTNSDNQSVKLVESALRLSVKALVEDKAQLSSQLVGRLMSYSIPEISELLNKAGKWNKQLWLQPLTPTLNPPGTNLVTQLDEPSGYIRKIAISDNTERVAYAVNDEQNNVAAKVKLWNVRENNPPTTLSDLSTTALALSADGSTLAIAHEGRVSIFDVSDTEKSQLLSFDTNTKIIEQICFFSTNKLSVLAKPGEIQTWVISDNDAEKIETFKLPQEFYYEISNKTTAYAPQKHRLFTGAGFISAQQFDEWDVLSESVHNSTKLGRFWSLAISPDCKSLVIEKKSLEIEVWKKHGNEYSCLCELGGHGFVLSDLAVTTTGSHVLSATPSEIKLWNTKPGLPRSIKPRSEDYINKLAISIDGKSGLAKTSKDNWKSINIVQRNLSASNLPQNTHLMNKYYDSAKLMLATPEGLLFKENNKVIETPIAGDTIAITQDGENAITASGDDCIVWNIDTRRIHTRITNCIDSTFKVVAVYPDGKHLATSIGNPSCVMLWDLKNGKLIGKLTGATWYIDCLTVASTVYGLRVVGGSRDKIVRVWDPEQEQPLLELKGHTYTISDVQVLQGGELLASCGGDNTLRLWDLETGECLNVYTADAWLMSCVVTPDGEQILASDMGNNLHFLEIVDKNSTY